MYKMITVGETSVGKSCLIIKWTTDKFDIGVESTIGASFHAKTYNCDNYKIKLQIWDTAGQERYRSLVPMYLRGSHIILFVFDLTYLDSFHSLIDKWIPSIKDTSGFNERNCLYYFVGTKYDLYENLDNKFNFKEYIDSLRLNFRYDYFEVSAKTNYGIDNMFYKIGKDLIRYKITPENHDSTKINNLNYKLIDDEYDIDNIKKINIKNNKSCC